MYNDYENDYFKNIYKAPEPIYPTLPEFKPILPVFKPISNYDHYDALTGHISSPMNSFLQNKKVDPLGNVCYLGGLETGIRVDSLGHLRDFSGNLHDPGSFGPSSAPLGPPAFPPLGPPRAF